METFLIKAHGDNLDFLNIEKWNWIKLTIFNSHFDILFIDDA